MAGRIVASGTDNSGFELFLFRQDALRGVGLYEPEAHGPEAE